MHTSIKKCIYLKNKHPESILKYSFFTKNFLNRLIPPIKKNWKELKYVIYLK